MHLIVVLTVSVLCKSFSNATKLPLYYKKCEAQDQHCLGLNIQEAIRKLGKGSPAYGLIAIDPLVIPEMTVGAGKSVVNVQQFYKNVSITGFKAITIDEFDLDMEKGTLSIQMTYPGFKMDAKYTMMGRILVLPVLGNGNCTIILDKANPTYQATFDVSPRKKEKYIKIKNHKYHINAGFAKYYFENVFNGNKRLGDEINKVINENWKEIYDEVVPGYEAAIGILLTSIANRFLSRVPVSEFFLHQT